LTLKLKLSSRINLSIEPWKVIHLLSIILFVQYLLSTISIDYIPFFAYQSPLTNCNLCVCFPCRTCPTLTLRLIIFLLIRALSFNDGSFYRAYITIVVVKILMSLWFCLSIYNSIEMGYSCLRRLVLVIQNIKILL
jgi:hypothetical protein